MIDRTAMRVHAHGNKPAGGQAAQAMARSRSSLSNKIHLARDAFGTISPALNTEAKIRADLVALTGDRAAMPPVSGAQSS